MSGEAVAGWAASGAMWLTGHAGGPPLAPAAAVVPALGARAEDVRRGAAAAGAPAGVRVDVAEALAGRAALLGLARGGRTSANGTCRLLPAADGWVAVNLARPADVEAVGALVERAVGGDVPWDALARWAERTPADDVVERAALLGLPAGRLPEPGAPQPAVTTVAAGPAGPPPAADGRRRLVVDLSSMWAGPLCARLLGLAGLRVVKVEGTGRPDGARRGHPGFFDWLHGGHESVALDLGSEGGRDALRRLVRRADVVIEASRPRALAQLGIDAEAEVAARPGTTWVSITGYGRSGPGAGRVAFGDDAAVAGGLVARDAEGLPVFCADAVADPITGLHAAAAAMASVAAGGGHLVDVPMVGAVAAACATPAEPAAARPGGGSTDPGGGEPAWVVDTDGGPVAVAPPRPPGPPVAVARPLGADTDAVLAGLAGPAC